MDENEVDQHLSRITTMWTVVFQAHKGSQEKVSEAQGLLLKRYCGAIYKYLLGAVRDVHVADELAQEFALGFVAGRFHGADPERGRFRDYVKTSLFNLVRKHFRKENRQPLGLDLDVHEPAAAQEAMPSDEAFVDSWRQELLSRTWEALAQLEQTTGQLFHTMLDYRTKNADVSSAQMADTLSEKLGKKLTAAGVRQTIHRAREKFADLLLDEVARSLETSDIERIEQELIDLGLLAYCQDALQRRKAP